MPEFPVIIKKRDKELRIYGPTATKSRYRVVYKTGGKRREKVYPNYDLAKREAEVLLRQLSTDTEHLLQLSSREAREYLQLKRKAAERGRSPIDVIHDWYEATEFLCDPVDLVKAARAFEKDTLSQSLSVEDAVRSYLEAKAPQLADRTFDQLRLTLFRFQESFICQVGDLTREAIKNYIQSLLNKRDGKPITPKTRNHHRTYIKGFLKWCSKELLITDSQWLELSRALENERERNLKSIKIYTPQELEMLLMCATGNLRVLIGIAAFSGLRTAELLRLSWEDIKGKNVEVRAENAKTRTRRLAPICDALKGLLKETDSKHGSVWSYSLSWFRDCVAKLFKDAQVTKHPNALRHSFISYRLALTGDEKRTALEAGNTPDMIFQYYRELVTEEQAEKWFSVKK